MILLLSHYDSLCLFACYVLPSVCTSSACLISTLSCAYNKSCSCKKSSSCNNSLSYSDPFTCQMCCEFDKLSDVCQKSTMTSLPASRPILTHHTHLYKLFTRTFTTSCTKTCTNDCTIPLTPTPNSCPNTKV